MYISQNLPNYHANMGGGKSEFKVKSFLGTLGTKIFHANADIETNTYASNLIGEGYREDKSRTVTTASENFSASKTTSLKLEKMARAEEFVGLRTGGPQNKNLIDAYVHKQGTPFNRDLNFRRVRFSQNYRI